MEPEKLPPNYCREDHAVVIPKHLTGRARQGRLRQFDLINGVLELVYQAHPVPFSDVADLCRPEWLGVFDIPTLDWVEPILIYSDAELLQAWKRKENRGG